MTAVSNSYTPQLAISGGAVKLNSHLNPSRPHTRTFGQNVLRIGNFFLDGGRILCFPLLAARQPAAHTGPRELFLGGNTWKYRHFAPFSRRGQPKVGTRGAFTLPRHHLTT